MSSSMAESGQDLHKNPDESPAIKSQDNENEEDLFESGSEEDPEVVAAREKNLEGYRKNKAARKKPAAKSMITLDIKPYDDEVNMDELKDEVLQITMDGLVWGTSVFVPVGYGIQKLRINLVVEDEKVRLDELEDRIVEDSDYVQSMDVVGMQKL